MDGKEYPKELLKVKKKISQTEKRIRILTNFHSKLLKRKEKLELLIAKCRSEAEDKDKVWSESNFAWSEALKTNMSTVFHINELRPLQLETMNVTMSGKDCFLIMPTGGGKSLCFQLPALISSGITLVVSPLLSLVEDQLVALEMLGVHADTLNATTAKEKVKKITDAMLDPKAPLRLLYVTPEKLAKSKRFMANLEKMYNCGRFSRLVIDEVHCCSQWGHDFRPDYKFLGIMKSQFPKVPILGLTATASSHVIKDIKKILNLSHSYTFRAAFNRPNLFYEVREKPSSAKSVLDEISNLILKKFFGKSGIVYCYSRKESEEVATGLRELGVKAACYHADLENERRKRTHRAWLSGSIQVIVATVAFGMGIDKPDVRFVIHHSLSKSMENFYQESGRAGRDDKFSHCIVYYRLQDVMRQSRMVFTEQKGMENLYGLMEYCSDIERCRRTMIAKHFGENSTSIECNKMCDICKSKPHYDLKEIDMSRRCSDIIKLVNRGVAIDKKLTVNKLYDAWLGKGPPESRLKEIQSPNLTLEQYDRIIATMLIRGHLKEEFHFTPYTTICYLVPGPMAPVLNAGGKFLIKVKVKKKQNSLSNEASSLETSEGEDKPVSQSKSAEEHDRVKKTSLSGQDSCSSKIKTSEAIIIDDESHSGGDSDLDLDCDSDGDMDFDSDVDSDCNLDSD